MRQTEIHPLIASSVAHYELEFIHPFSDGNGRIGRLWQTLILKSWKPQLAYIPFETVVHDGQSEYYEALGKSDQIADSAPFVEFCLQAILSSLREVSDQVSDQVNQLLSVMPVGKALTFSELLAKVGLKHRPTFRKNYLNPAMDAGLVSMEFPESPNSPKQRYLRK